jgi:hypothetical protein
MTEDISHYDVKKITKNKLELFKKFTIIKIKK